MRILARPFRSRPGARDERPLAALAALALALGLAACGAGSGATSSSSSPAATGASAPSTSTTADAKPTKPAAAKPSRSRSAHFTGSTRASSGAGARAFETRGGDNSIQEFGTETGGSELARAAAALHAYLDARTTERWARACSYLASSVTESLRQLAGAAKQAKGKSAGCPHLIAAMSAGMPAYLRHELTQVEAGALRVKGSSAFLLYHGAHHTDYFMPMARESDHWKVAAIAASALP